MTSDGATAEVTAKALSCAGPTGHLGRGAVGTERLKEHPERREVLAAEGMDVADHPDHADRRQDRPAHSRSRSPRLPRHKDQSGADHAPGLQSGHGHTIGLGPSGAAAESFGGRGDDDDDDGDGAKRQLRAAGTAAHDQPDLHDSRRRSSGSGGRTHSRSRSRSLSRDGAAGAASGGEDRKLGLHRETDRERVSKRREDQEHEEEGGSEGPERRGHKRDQPDRRGSRSRSRSGSLGREREQERERERERSHVRDRDQETQRGRERERERDLERDRAPKRPHAEATLNGRAAAPAPAGAADARAAAGHRVSGGGAGAPGAHAAAPSHSRLLVSFSDELNEEGGLGDGGAGGGGRRRSNGGGGMGYGGGNINLSSLTTAAPGVGMGGGPMLIPTRTITTAGGGGGSAGGGAAGLAAQFSGFGGGAAAAAAPPPLHGSVGPYHHSSIVGGGGTAAAAVAGMATEAAAVLGSPLVLGGGGHRAGGDELGAVAGGSPPRSPPGGGGGGRTLGRVLFGVSTARCLRPYMEDRHAVVQSLQPLAASGAPLPADGVPRCLAAIYDGHNGTRAADTAASRLHMLLAADAALRSHTGELGPPAAMAAEEEAVAGALRRVFRRLDDDILAEARRDGARDGATALLVMRLADTLYAAHAGDSRAVLSRRGAALRLTEDHKPNLPHERRRVEAAGGRVDFQRCWRVIVEPREGRLGSGLAARAVRALHGAGAAASPMASFAANTSPGAQQQQQQQQHGGGGSSSPLRPHPGPRPHQLPPPGYVYREEDARAAADALLEAAVRRGTADNVTVIVMLLQWD
ncbi:hypothetical protein CHLRE_04g229494v5 [Chlamydomonas reinhardtii]|uniref:PPM-type phosphatase domain-containing protein n=1 Tax=Chlamydomonas reinhardtii TaxID=3055 RepID=A0A2K3DUW6_CHLRE|nr:uncharacterized protein CHLRE_04g229494v5 [Chlamydomonas reinhardtii]PNW84319.1 hypothetical protein CHLRE_04g229494v5 [Chlamydomonas reinhardtii]